MLKSSFFYFFIFLFFLVSCFDEEKNKNHIDIKNGLIINFESDLDGTLLLNYKFGLCTDSEELPLDSIFSRNSFFTIEESKVILNEQFVKKYLKEGDTLNGYFSKEGFHLKKFSILNEIGVITVKVSPNPSTVLLKAMDKNFKTRFDSVLVKIDKKGKNIYENYEVIKGTITEEYKFVKENQDFTKDLHIMNFDILPNENWEFEVVVYNKNKYYKNIYKLGYQPFMESIIKVY